MPSSFCDSKTPSSVVVNFVVFAVVVVVVVVVVDDGDDDVRTGLAAVVGSFEGWSSFADDLILSSSLDIPCLHVSVVSEILQCVCMQ